MERGAVRIANAVYSTMLFLTSPPRDKFSSTDFDRCLVDLESWLMRRFMCRLTNRNYNRFFLGVPIKVKSAAEEGKSVADALRNKLLRSKEVTTKWPADNEFKNGWLTNQWTSNRGSTAVG